MLGPINNDEIYNRVKFYITDVEPIYRNRREFILTAGVSPEYLIYLCPHDENYMKAIEGFYLLWEDYARSN